MEYEREYFQRPEVKEKRREYHREYYHRPENKERMREYKREYFQRPEVKERKREYDREYFQRPEVKEKREYDKQAYCDDIIHLLRTEGARKIEDLPFPRAKRDTRALERMGVVEVGEDGMVSLVDSPLLAAFDGFYQEKREEVSK